MKKKDPTLNGQQLRNLLARYKHILKPPQASVEKECVQVVKDVCGIEIKQHHLSYSVPTKTLHIKTPSIIRSELKIHHPQILSELRRRLGDSAPSSIV